MNRLDQRLHFARVDFNQSIENGDAPDTQGRRPILLPVVQFYAAVLGFVCCGAVVVISAGMLALQIQ